MIGKEIAELEVSFKYNDELINESLNSLPSGSEVILKGDNILKYQEIPGLLRNLKKRSITSDVEIKCSDLLSDNEFFLLRRLIKDSLVRNVIIKCRSVDDISNIEYLDKYSIGCSLIIIVNESISNNNLLSLLNLDNSIVVIDSDTQYRYLIDDKISTVSKDKNSMKKLLYSDNVYNLLNESDINKLYDYSITKCITI